MSAGWKGDLTPLLQRLSQIATGAGSLFVFAAGSRLALALPADPRAARTVAGLYQPQRWKGRIFLTIAKWMIVFGIPKLRPTYRGTGNQVPEVDWLKEAAAQGCVGFLGCNPAHGPRCILAGIDPASGGKFIAKLGLEESALAIRREADVLERLNGRFPGVVQSMGLENSGSDSGFDWALLRLPHLGNDAPESMAKPEVGGLLQKWLGETSKPLGGYPWADRLLERVAADDAPANWHDRMRSRQIRTALFHGDFATWNLRNTPDGLVAIDWEWAVEDGIAGIDLAHGLRQECYMVRRMEAGQAVAWMLARARSGMWRTYLEASGWAGAEEDWLRIGLLHSHFNAKNPSRELLRVLGVRVG